MTFVNEASDEWEGDDLVHEKDRPNIPNVLAPNDSPGQRRETQSEVTAEDGSYCSNKHALELPNTSSPQAPYPDEAPTLSLREASLMRCFIQKIAPWVSNSHSSGTGEGRDLNKDRRIYVTPQSHFSTVVPRHAMEVPMVLKAVLALAARHDAILNNTSDWEASSYHGQCLELLITALDRPEHAYDENLLVTVVILRIYEELEYNTDKRFHLLGSNRLINLMSRSASSGGMTEAVSWQFLRQAIYASAVQYQHFQLDLRNYEQSSMFQRNDDTAFANIIIFHCAHIIQLCRHFPEKTVEGSAWHQVAGAVDEWHGKKPRTWQPIRYQAPDVAAGRPFPEIWMMSVPAGLYSNHPWRDSDAADDGIQ